MKRLLHIIVLIFISNSSYCQAYKRDNMWMLGAYAAPGYPKFGINFNSGFADTLSLIRQMAFFLTNASICDTNGNLLFYTNGNYVANSKHQIMPGTIGFNPGDHTTEQFPYGNAIVQGVLILPWPEKPTKYAMIHMSGEWFTVNGWSYERPLSLMYSVIDMNLDNGYGDFTGTMNEILISDTLATGRITACKHANGRDWWVISHEAWSNQFYFFLLNPDSIYLHHSQFIGPDVESEHDVYGNAIFTNDGSKLAYQTDSTITIYDFDRCSGLFSNPVNVYFPDTLNLAMLSCAFSASGRYLYGCNNFHIFQMDMQAVDIPASKTIVSTYDGFRTTQNFRTIFDLMKLAPDNKIYVSTYEGSNYFHVINDPEGNGVLCNTTQHSFLLPSFNAFSMPNSANYSLGALAGSSCDTLSNGVTELANRFSIATFPNPAGDKLFVRLDKDNSAGNITLGLIDITGKNILEQPVKHEAIIELDVSHLPAGLYILKATINSRQQWAGKVSIVR